VKLYIDCTVFNNGFLSTNQIVEIVQSPQNLYLLSLTSNNLRRLHSALSNLEKFQPLNQDLANNYYIIKWRIY
jgi:hypothetical protein